MKRWLVGILLAALAGVLLVVAIDSKRDPIAILERHGGKIERNEQGEVVGVDLRDASMSPTGQKLLHLIGLGEQRLSLSDAALVHLKGLTNLQTLNLHGTKITDAGLVHLKGLPNLQTLYLYGTQITAAGLVHLKGMTKLRHLGIGGTGRGPFKLTNSITNSGLVHLKGLAKLETLDLNGTKITDAGLVNLKGLANLKQLSLRYTQTTRGGVANLKKVFPDCRIVR